MFCSRHREFDLSSIRDIEIRLYFSFYFINITGVRIEHELFHIYGKTNHERVTINIAGASFGHGPHERVTINIAGASIGHGSIKKISY